MTAIRCAWIDVRHTAAAPQLAAAPSSRPIVRAAFRDKARSISTFSRLGRLRLDSSIITDFGVVSSSKGSRLLVCAALEVLDGYGDAAIDLHGSGSMGASASLEASEVVSTPGTSDAEDVSSTGQDTTARGSVGVVEAMTGKTVDVNAIDGGIGGDSGHGGDGGGGGGGGSGGGDGSPEPDKAKNPKILSMSQKLTLVYAAIVGVGGLVGFLKSGSTKSLFSGGITALTLYNVYTQLPVNPVEASYLGAGVSLLLLFVMGSRFKNSGKLFPAGVVSFVSLVMTGGYVHGIMRSSHA